MNNEKSITITPPEGYEIDKEKSTLEKIVFRALPDNKLPRTYGGMGAFGGFYVDPIIGRICKGNELPFPEGICGLWPTAEEAEASIALAQLCQLRDRYNGGWKPDWGNDAPIKYTIVLGGGSIAADFNYRVSHVLAFKTEELRDKFLENFRDLIEKAKPLL